MKKSEIMKKILSLFALMLLTIFCIKAQGISNRAPEYGNASVNTRLCNVIPVTDTVPWLDDFSSAPACWTFPTDDNTSWAWDNTGDFIYHDYGTYESDAISPILDISSVTTPYLKFSHKRPDISSSTISDELYVYYRSIGANVDSTWYLLGTYTGVCNSWFTDSIPLPLYLANIQLKFHAKGNGINANGVNISFVSIYNEENAPVCIAPTALNVFNTEEYSVELSWGLASEGTVTLYYRVISDTIYNEIEGVTLTNGVYLLDELETATQYVWYLGLDCGGETSQTALHYFTTDCGLLSAPRYEDFEYVNIGENPACWEILNSTTEGTYTFPGVSNITNQQYSHSGSHSYKFGANGTPQYAIMPEFDNIFSTLQVNFWTRRHGSSSGSLSVGYITDTLNADHFVSLMTLSSSEIGDNSYHNYTVRFNSVTTVESSHYHIAFKYEGSENWYWFIDDIRVTEIIPCDTPDSLSANNATGTSIDLSWTGNASHYSLYYKIVGETDYDFIDHVTLDANRVYTLEGLTPSSNYEWYVEAYCSDGSVVTSFISGHFTTVCGAINSVPVSWDFEDNLTAGTPDYPLPTCWSRIPSNSSQPHPSVDPQSMYAHNSQRSLRFHNRYPNSYAVMPAVSNNLNFANLQISFYMKTSSVNNAVSLEIGLMTDPEDASTFTTVSTISPTNTDYTFYEIPFFGYTNSGNYIAFRNTSSSTGNVWSSFYVDDLTLSSIAGCTAPLNLTAVASTNSATLSWVSSGTTFTLYYKEADDNLWQSVNDVTLDNNTEYELTGLLAGTAYDWYVETACGTTPELTSEQAYFTTVMEPVDLPYQTDFSNGQDWLMNNGHAGNYWTSGIPSGDSQTALFITSEGSYASYNTTVNAVVTAEKAFNMPESSSVHVEFDVKAGGEGDYTHYPQDYLKVFLAPKNVEYTAGATSSNAQSGVDYNIHAFNFSDYIGLTEEINHPYKINSTQNSTIHISMNVANPAMGGEAKIVFLWRNDDYLGTQPSAIIRNFFITEDTAYTPPTPPTPLTCDVPANVTTANVSHNSADISWAAGGDETAWNIQWKESSASSWGNVIPVTTRSYHLSGLNPETAYQWRVQANCVDTLSDWTNPVDFTTLEEVGIDNITLANNISLMPNPADHYIDLRVNGKMTAKEAVIYNAFGQLIQTVELTDNHVRIDLSGMAAGMYFVRVNGDHGTATKKFIKK